MSDWWLRPESVVSYASLGESLEWQIGYPTLLNSLEPLRGSAVLDYGSGPGRVADWIRRRYECRVVGVDVSTEMVKLASEDFAGPDLNFHHLDGGGLPFPDGSFDAAVCCFVLCVLGSAAEQRFVCQEVHRVLRPGGRFGIIVPHPDSTGISYGTCQTGEPGRTYQPGDAVPTWLTSNSQELLIEDHWWPAQHYRDLLAASGFHAVTELAPLPNDGPQQPPFLLLTGAR